MKNIFTPFFLALLITWVSNVNCFGGWETTQQGIGQGPTTVSPNQCISDGNGGEIICSRDTRSGTINSLYVQHIDVNGVPLWGDHSFGGTGRLITQLESLAFEQYFSIVSDGANGALVVWIQNDHEIRAQRVSASGSLLWATGGVLVGQCSGSDEFRSVKAIANESGGFYVTWGFEANPSVPLPRLQLINSSGVPQYSLSGIQIDGNKCMISDNAGGVFLAWSPWTSLGTPRKVIAQRLNSSGSKLWGANGKELVTFIHLSGYYSFDIMQLSGGLMLTYNDSTNVWDDVFVKRLNATGNFVFGEFNGVNITNDPDHITSTKIISDKLFGALVYWQANGKVKITRLSSMANPIWSGPPVDLFTGLNISSSISIAVNSFNYFIKGEYSSLNSKGITVQKVSALTGTKLWGADGIAFEDCFSTFNITYNYFPDQAIICDNASNLIINCYSTFFPSLNEVTKWYKLRVYKLNASGLHQWSSIGKPIYAERNISSNPPAICKSLYGYFTIWEDLRHPDTSRIYQRFIDTKGNKNTDSTSENYFGKRVSLRNSEQTTPISISDDAGGAIIVWQDKTSGDNNIYAQRMDASGARLWGENGVAICNATGWQVKPQIVKDEAGGYIILWEDTRTGSNIDLYAQRVSQSGVKQWVVNGVPISNAPGFHPNAKMVATTTGGALIAWEDTRNGNYDIFAQRVNSTGTMNWAANGVAVCTQSSLQEDVTISLYSIGGSFISWSDRRNGNDDIYTQRLSGTGSPQWASNGIPICNLSSTQQHPFSIPDSTDKCIVGWYDYRTGGRKVFAQKIDENGLSLWTANGVNTQTDTSGNNYNAKMISDGRRGAIIILQNDRKSLSEHHIFARRIDQNGISKWAFNSNGISNSNSNNYHQAYPSICSDGKNGVVAFWNDQFENQPNNVSVQRVNHEGLLGTFSDIQVSGNTIEIEDGDSIPDVADETDFGLQHVGTTGINTFIVKNIEYGNLSIYSPSITGTDATSFSITGFNGGSLLYNQSFSFNINFSPYATGLKTAYINISSNDPNEATYTFKIQGLAYVPDIINTYAGNGNIGNTGNGGAAILAQMHTPTVLTSDSIGNIYFADSAYHVIRKVDTNGVITLFAGTGVSGYNGENITRLSAQIKSPTGMAYRKQNGGELFFAESGNSRVRKIQMSTGLISTLVGTGVAGYNGSGLAGTATQLSQPLGICTDGAYLYIADNGNSRVRKVGLFGSNNVTNFAGNGSVGYTGDGGSPTSATLNNPVDVCLNKTSSSLYIADKGNHVIRKASTLPFFGSISTYVGTGVAGYSGNNAPLSIAKLNQPYDVEVDSNNVLYIADLNNHRVCKVSNIFILGDVLINEAGTTTAGFSGDGGPAENAKLNNPRGLCVDPKNRLFITDKGNHRIRILGNVNKPALITHCTIQGFYAGSGRMRPVLENQGVSSSPLFSDSIQIELHHTIAPYVLIASEKIRMDRQGYASCNFAHLHGTFYVAFKHRNGILTWGANTVILNGSTVTYNLNSLASAYGNNVVWLSNSPTTYGIYSGDLNQDENIDLLDASILENDINSFQFGYTETDINGDGNVDLLDLPIVEDNISNFIFSNHP